MKDPFAVMPQPTAAMFKLLLDIPWLNDFILIGGTGLALHIGHRKSEDLDFITVHQRLPRPILTRLETTLGRQGHTVVHKDDPNVADEFENAGMDIRDYSQTWIINNDVKVTFFSADEHHARILDATLWGDCFRVGTFTELCQLKALVASSRAKSRDWLDLFVLEHDYQFGLASWKEAYDKAGLTGGQFEFALKRICDGRVSLLDEGFEALMEAPPTLEDIQAHFQTLRQAYEISTAKAKLSKERGK